MKDVQDVGRWRPVSLCEHIPEGIQSYLPSIFFFHTSQNKQPRPFLSMADENVQR